MRKTTMSMVALATWVLAGCTDTTNQTATTASEATTATTVTGGMTASTAPPADSSTTTAETTVAPAEQIPKVETVPLPGLFDESNEEVPNTLDYETGVLDNGLTYYVMANDRPGSKATLRLAIDAGSVDELDATTGVAHFTEHMMFNGTEEYPKNELIDVLGQFGATFGADINAYTSFTETVYELEVPNTTESLQLGIDVLDQWLTAATITEADVTAERGVIADEWRTRTQTGPGRLYEIAAAMYLADTPYQDRAAIGSIESIESMEAATVRQYYDTWYRPERAAVIVVGEIEVDATVELLKTQFGDATARTDAVEPQPDVEFGLDTEADFALHRDVEQETVDVEVGLPLPAVTGNGTLTLRAQVVDRVVYDAIIRRLQRDVAAGSAPFDEIQLGSNSYVDELDAPALYAVTDAPRARDTLVALLAEYERIARFGFNEAEIAAAVAAERATWDSFVLADGERQDSALSTMLVENFLNDQPAARLGDIYDAALAELEQIDAQAATRRFLARWTNSAPHVIISTPESVAEQVPNRDQVLALIENLSQTTIEPRGERAELPDQLMARPDGVEPVEEIVLTEYGWENFNPIEYRYPNGARVILNPNTIVQGEAFLLATSRGGTSVIADDAVIDAMYAGQILESSGLGEFNAADVADITADSTTTLNGSIEVYEEQFSGKASSTDIETMLQRLHLSMTAPRFDQVGLGQVRQSEQAVVDDPTINPDRASLDALLETRYNDARYDAIPSPAAFDTLDLAGVQAVWADRMDNAGDWLFILNGDFDRDEMLELTNAYIGSLPGTGDAETPVDVSGPVPDGVTAVEIAAGSGETASVEMLFSTPIVAISPANQAAVDVTMAVLEQRLTRVIREEFGESYSPVISMSLDRDLEPTVLTYINITGAPDRVDQIADLVIGQIDDLASGGLSQAEFESAYTPVAEQYNFVSNNEFARELYREASIEGYNLDDYVLSFETIEQVGLDGVVAFLNNHLPTDNYVQVLRKPRQ